MKKIKKLLFEPVAVAAIVCGFTLVYWCLWVNLLMKGLLLSMVKLGFDDSLTIYLGKSLFVFGLVFYPLIPVWFAYHKFKKRRSRV